MKRLYYAASVMLLIFSLAIGCNKNDDHGNPAVLNSPPVAKAGPDIHKLLSPCSYGQSVELDGNNSFDLDDGIINYSWVQISGPQTYHGVITNRGKNLRLDNIFAGVYAFEHVVTDLGGQKGRDTMSVYVTGTHEIYDIDDVVNATYVFYDNYYSCPPQWDYGGTGICEYVDHTVVQGTVIIPGPGLFHFRIYEFADSANTTIRQSNFEFVRNTGLTYILSGESQLNFKSLILRGGGSFSGNLVMKAGTAATCTPWLFVGPPPAFLPGTTPLNVDGNLDIASGTVSMRIRGRVYF
jgi:hypothetical protein